jgi:hypothetical protein
VSIVCCADQGIYVLSCRKTRQGYLFAFALMYPLVQCSLVALMFSLHFHECSSFIQFRLKWMRLVIPDEMYFAESKSLFVIRVDGSDETVWD